MKTLKTHLLAAAGLGMALTPGTATAQTMQADNTTQTQAKPAMNPDAQPDPYSMKDESWLSLSGTVTNATSDGFTLDYGDGVVAVEMDDYDAWPEAYLLADGQNVAVVGKIDDDLFELTSIEAATVYVAGLNTSFSANAADEETIGDVAFYRLPDLSNVVLEGIVKDVDADDEEFTLTAGGASYEVSTEELGYNPLDDDGYQQISNDDRVRITGTLDAESLDSREFEATSIVTLKES